MCEKEPLYSIKRACIRPNEPCLLQQSREPCIIYTATQCNNKQMVRGAHNKQMVRGALHHLQTTHCNTVQHQTNGAGCPASCIGKGSDNAQDKHCSLNAIPVSFDRIKGSFDGT